MPDPTPDPWAAAVEVGERERSRVREACLYYSCGHDGCCCSPVNGETPHGDAAQDRAFLRAALPHLLVAVVDELQQEDQGLMADLLMPAAYAPSRFRRRILTALQRAAARLTIHQEGAC